MSMPSGDSPQVAEAYYRYLLSHQETFQKPDTWHVHWIDLAWLWGFAIALVLVLLLWIWQNRTTRQRRGIYPIDTFGGYTSEMAGPATGFFLLLTALLTGWGIAIIIGHAIWGQKF